MYRIGQFSKIAKVTVKALRHYEEQGLLDPAYVDPSSGYRYYESSQLPRVHQVVALRQCGFSLAEIRRLLAGSDPVRLLAEHRDRLEEELGVTAQRLASIRSYLRSLTEDGEMTYQVVVKPLPGALVISRRMVVPDYDSYFDIIPALGREVLAANPALEGTDPPYCFIEYHDGEYTDRDIDVEYCEAVRARGVDTPTVTFKTISAVPEAACVLHQGPYSTLRSAYKAVFSWIDDNGYEPSGNPRESYHDGIWNSPDPAQWLTEVQIPLRR
jgi:DNA-binding transcriptional MerR regulator/effector-binding domain-containing protein